GNVPRVHLGLIESERVLSVGKSAADVLGVPSLQDNLRNTVLESLTCGAPVVAFDVGGIPELVRPEVTGTLVPRGDIKALCGAIKNLFENPSMRVAMSANCRNIAQEYSLESCARRYVELYTRVAQ